MVESWGEKVFRRSATMRRCQQREWRNKTRFFYNAIGSHNTHTLFFEFLELLIPQYQCPTLCCFNHMAISPPSNRLPMVSELLQGILVLHIKQQRPRKSLQRNPCLALQNLAKLHTEVDDIKVCFRERPAKAWMLLEVEDLP